MWREERFIAFSQNSIINPLLVDGLISKSCISASDNLIEIGSGNGVITKKLCEVARHVTAIEIDRRLYSSLKQNLKYTNLTLIHQNFLTSSLPKSAFKVFSNIPFNYTSRIMKKLYFSENPPEVAYLVMQKEAADLYLGRKRENMKAVLLKPFFCFSIFHVFNRADFYPLPSVYAVLLKINKLDKPLISWVDRTEYCDFISYAFLRSGANIKDTLKQLFTYPQLKRLAKANKFRLTSRLTDLTTEQWVGLFNYFKVGVSPDKKFLIKCGYQKQLNKQSILSKSYRTICARNTYSKHPLS